MGESKPLASLSPSLLARKGQAAPAMRRQGSVTQVHYNGHNPLENHHLEDLGWNDMGSEGKVGEVHAFTANTQFEAHDVPAVVHQQDALAQQFARPVEPEPVVQNAVRPRAAAGSRGKAAFTLRLDGERHLKLRLVCAVDHRSAQQIVTQALDEFLERQPITAEISAAKAAAQCNSN